MGSIDKVVQVVITKGTRVVSQTAFGIPAIFGPSNRMGSDAFRIYSDPADMLDDGFLSSDPEYKHAVSLMSNQKKPAQFVISKFSAAVAQVATLTPDVTLQSIQHFIATIDAVAYDFTSDATPTAAEVVTGLIALINADVNCKMAASGTNTLILTAKVAGIGSTVTGSANLPVVQTTPNHSITDDIHALQQINDNWYATIITSKAKADILQVAAYIETQLKLFGFSTADVDTQTSVVTDIFSLLKSKNYERTFGLFSAEAASGPEASWIGQIVAQTPGSATWKFKTLVGIDSDNLNDTQETNIQGKNGNVYVDIGGVDITSEGVCADGEYIDIVLGDDWLSSTMKVNVFTPLVNEPKIPFNNKGIVAIENAVTQTLKQGSKNNFLNDDYSVTVPDQNDISTADKNSRTLNGVVFNATHSGAIHKVNIQGFIGV